MTHKRLEYLFRKQTGYAWPTQELHLSTGEEGAVAGRKHSECAAQYSDNGIIPVGLDDVPGCSQFPAGYDIAGVVTCGIDHYGNIPDPLHLFQPFQEYFSIQPREIQIQKDVRRGEVFVIFQPVQSGRTATLYH